MTKEFLTFIVTHEFLFLQMYHNYYFIWKTELGVNPSTTIV
nr:MAG TPA: hypothetical protein [Caudoviricetes sp.]